MQSASKGLHRLDMEEILYFLQEGVSPENAHVEVSGSVHLFTRPASSDNETGLTLSASESQLDQLFAEVDKFFVLGVMGTQCCGKSTLLNFLAGARNLFNVGGVGDHELGLDMTVGVHAAMVKCAGQGLLLLDAEGTGASPIRSAQIMGLLTMFADLVVYNIQGHVRQLAATIRDDVKRYCQFVGDGIDEIQQLANKLIVVERDVGASYVQPQGPWRKFVKEWSPDFARLPRPNFGSDSQSPHVVGDSCQEFQDAFRQLCEQLCNRLRQVRHCHSASSFRTALTQFAPIFEKIGDSAAFGRVREHFAVEHIVEYLQGRLAVLPVFPATATVFLRAEKDLSQIVNGASIFRRRFRAGASVLLDSWRNDNLSATVQARLNTIRGENDAALKWNATFQLFFGLNHELCPTWTDFVSLRDNLHRELDTELENIRRQLPTGSYQPPQWRSQLLSGNQFVVCGGHHTTVSFIPSTTPSVRTPIEVHQSEESMGSSADSTSSHVESDAANVASDPVNAANDPVNAGHDPVNAASDSLNGASDSAHAASSSHTGAATQAADASAAGSSGGGMPSHSDGESAPFTQPPPTANLGARTTEWNPQDEVRRAESMRPPKSSLFGRLLGFPRGHRTYTRTVEVEGRLSTVTVECELDKRGYHVRNMRVDALPGAAPDGIDSSRSPTLVRDNIRTVNKVVHEVTDSVAGNIRSHAPADGSGTSGDAASAGVKTDGASAGVETGGASAGVETGGASASDGGEAPPTNTADGADGDPAAKSDSSPQNASRAVFTILDAAAIMRPHLLEALYDEETRGPGNVRRLLGRLFGTPRATAKTLFKVASICLPFTGIGAVPSLVTVLALGTASNAVDGKFSLETLIPSKTLLAQSVASVCGLPTWMLSTLLHSAATAQDVYQHRQAWKSKLGAHGLCTIHTMLHAAGQPTMLTDNIESVLTENLAQFSAWATRNAAEDWPLRTVDAINPRSVGNLVLILGGRYRRCLGTWATFENKLCQLDSASIETRQQRGRREVGCRHNAVHSVVVKALLSQWWSRNVGDGRLPLVQRSLGMHFSGTKALVIEELAVVHFLKQFQGREQLWEPRRANRDAQTTLISNQVTHVVFGLTHLQLVCRFDPHWLLPSLLGVTTRAQMTDRPQVARYTIAVDQATGQAVEATLNVRSEGAVRLVDVGSASFRFEETCDVCLQRSRNEGNMRAVLNRFRGARANQRADAERFPFSDTFALQMFFCAAGKTVELNLWRNNVVAAFFAEQRLALVRDNYARVRDEAGARPQDNLGGRLEHTFPFLAGLIEVINPTRAVSLSSSRFAQCLNNDDQRLLTDVSLLPTRCALKPRFAPLWPGWRRDNGTLDNGDMSVLLQPNVLSSNPIDVVDRLLNPLRGDGNPVYLNWKDLDASNVAELLNATNQDMCCIGGGQSGNALIRTRHRIPKDDIEIAVVCKRFVNANVVLENSRNPTIYCEEATLECVVSAIAADLYERGDCVNFPRLYEAVRVRPNQHSAADSSSSTVLLFMEQADAGDMNSNFAAMVATLQAKVIAEGGEPANCEAYAHNAIAQVTMALAVFAEKCHGMHNDLHLGNVMLKYCDDHTTFGPPGRSLAEHTHFEYKIQNHTYRIPNMGFVVKLIDFGLASAAIPLSNSGYGRRFCRKRESAERECARTMAGKIASMLGGQRFGYPFLVERWAMAAEMRTGGLFCEPFDLQTFGNHLSSHLLFYRNPLTINYEYAEYAEHLATTCRRSDIPFVPMNITLHFDLVVNTVGARPTARIPRDLAHCQLTARQFVQRATFARYAVFEDADADTRSWQQVVSAEHAVESIDDLLVNVRRCENFGFNPQDIAELQREQDTIDTAELAPVHQELFENIKLRIEALELREQQEREREQQENERQERGRPG